MSGVRASSELIVVPLKHDWSSLRISMVPVLDGARSGRTCLAEVS